MSTRNAEVESARAWRSFRQGDQKAREWLILHNEKLVYITAFRMHARLSRAVELDDLQSEGFVGLIKAVDTFDQGRGVKFSTYAIALIRGAIQEYLRNDDWVPRLVRTQQRACQVCEEALFVRLRRHATEEEI